MSIRIRPEKCARCGACVEACPGNLIEQRGGTGAARILRPRDCWGCTSCLKACRFGAIEFFLGADVGGTGAHLSYERSGGLVHWKVSCPDDREVAIDIDPTDANKY